MESESFSHSGVCGVDRTSPNLMSMSRQTLLLVCWSSWMFTWWNEEHAHRHAVRIRRCIQLACFQNASNVPYRRSTCLGGCRTLRSCSSCVPSCTERKSLRVLLQRSMSLSKDSLLYIVSVYVTLFSSNFKSSFARSIELRAASAAGSRGFFHKVISINTTEWLCE
jgi:hypothetical protein